MYKLLPSVSKDKNHPRAADELTRYMLTTGENSFEVSDNTSCCAGLAKKFESFEPWLCELWRGEKTGFLPVRENAAESL